ncbi:M23 family metallopeptidase [Curtobacterium sp. A7_M15]|uniref:M23 family metallopeptidase n=1 Tax=Curtobacterium sp. A7_M15 TaxID=3065241 RepID=UPI002737C8E8|nr:M23 family metallopeptidase [Curtobacterium sp. A7_M15]MDP4334610.1 M23 family metallopeptidase [Curtobacterium sp. A7_M15]
MPFRHTSPAMAALTLLVVSLPAGGPVAGSSPRAEATPLVTDLGADASRDDAGHVAGDAPWVWPTGSRVVGRPWEAPADDYAAGHRGIDVPAQLGTTVAAVDDGTVTFAGQVAGRGVVTIDHGGGLRSTVDSVVPSVATGDTVAQGEALGTVSVGHCPAADPCLHLGARLDDRYVDPTPYLPAAAWPVLLPESAWTG